ncbi:MAG: response regulator transcription factor [Dorea sp.]|uniref:response regulator transcription factor n=1 Tax=Sporofaciens musculi TaxID=2681861 RepID=UPI00216FBA82|nr:response regulator transcription factor [Sporofaciens musculi]MCI9422988.1 response regulator transcription factor [Dorea sp.]
MRILIIEDDEQLCETLQLQFEHHGMESDYVHSGLDALYYVMQSVYDLIILDRMLPGMDGIALLKIIRENNVHTPIILATAVDSVEERIAGLDNGADDYLVKPYDIGELLARIRALCRRPDTLEDKRTLTFEDLEFSLANLELSLKSTASVDTKLHLSRREAVLLEYFLLHPNQTLARQLIYTRVWGPDGEVEDGNLDTYIYYLRKHLRTIKSRVHIQTVHGIGYRLEAEK